MTAGRSLALWVWPLVLVVAGVLLLLNNYLLLEFDILQLWPLLLVALGLQVLLRGDLEFSRAGHNFGITRGSVQAGQLRANSGELDLRLRALEREGRLIAGQYTARSRPQLTVANEQATLIMQRGRTWPLSLADWDLALAQDLPWNLLLSTYLGEISVDLRGLIIERARLASGIGDLHAIAPDIPCGPLMLRSTFGDIHLTIPEHMEAAVTISPGPFFAARLQSDRWLPDGDHRYITPGYTSAEEPIDVTVSGTFGDLYLA